MPLVGRPMRSTLNPINTDQQQQPTRSSYPANAWALQQTHALPQLRACLIDQMTHRFVPTHKERTGITLLEITKSKRSKCLHEKARAAR